MPFESYNGFDTCIISPQQRSCPERPQESSARSTWRISSRFARRYNIPVIKMTSGQRMVLVGIKEEDAEAIWNELGMTVGQATAPCVHYVQACPGTAVCK